MAAIVKELAKLKFLRTYLHFPHGFLPILLVTLAPQFGVISTIWCLAFLSYELLQDREEHDKSYKDVYSFLLGVSLAGIGVIIWRILSY